MARWGRVVTRRGVPGIFAAACALWSSTAMAGEPSAMQRATADLRCTKEDDPAAIERVLDVIARAETTKLGVPASDLGSGSSLRASSLDRLLAQLAKVARRSDALRLRVERIVLSWSFCAVRFGDQSWNVVAGHSPRRRPAREPTGGWSGFAAWGFDRDQREMFGPPALVVAGPLGPGQTEGFVHVLHHERCFPSPATGHTVFEDDELDRTIAAPLLEEDDDEGNPEDPRDAIDNETGCSGPTPAADAPPPPPPPPAAAPAAGAAAPPATPTSVVSPTNQAAAGAPTADGVNIVGGSVYHARKLDGIPIYGLRAGLTPYSFLFARAGLEARRPVGGMVATASWGVGYDDWHPGTFYAQVNNWVVSLDKPMLLEGTMLDVGYRLPLPEKVAQYVGSSVGLNFPWAHRAGALAGVTVKPFGDFFLMAGVRMELARPSEWTWVYGFGIFDWHPFSFSAQYSNWGPNKAFVPNFVDNGSVTLSFSWAF
jgi:hypothetical protein